MPWRTRQGWIDYYQIAKGTAKLFLRDHGTHIIVVFTILGVDLLGRFYGLTAQFIEEIYTDIGAIGIIYALKTLQYRLDFEHWRKQKGRNGFMQITSIGYIWLSILCSIAQLFIFIAGITAMITPEAVREQLQVQDIIISFCLIGLGLIVMIISWFLDNIVNRQINYILSVEARQKKETGISRAE